MKIKLCHNDPIMFRFNKQVSIFVSLYLNKDLLLLDNNYSLESENIVEFMSVY